MMKFESNRVIISDRVQFGVEIRAEDLGLHKYTEEWFVLR
jgi:hypothetical protein